MRTIKCIGYEGYECGKTAKQTGNNQKRCPLCAVQAQLMGARKYGYKYNPEYNRSPGRRKAKRERGWRERGIIVENGGPLMDERFQQDAEAGCKLKGFGICGGRLCADHDHKTGRYRGPLCISHNNALGKLGDSPETLRQIAKILETKSKKQHAAKAGLGFKLPEVQ